VNKVYIQVTEVCRALTLFRRLRPCIVSFSSHLTKIHCLKYKACFATEARTSQRIHTDWIV